LQLKPRVLVDVSRSIPAGRCWGRRWSTRSYWRRRRRICWRTRTRRWRRRAGRRRRRRS
jgi:hypothetical protein